jgi:LysR family hydrogen peroxide-inducible transcriptional activator
MVPTLKQLRYFAALAETLHFGRAADRCQVTQPAMSMQVRELEALLGVILVERTASGVFLTAAGEEVAGRAREILLAVQDLTDLARHRDRMLAGPLRLGVIPTIGPYLLPQVLPRLHATYPDLRLSLRESQTEQLLDALLAGELDLLIVALPVGRDAVATRPLFDDTFNLAVAGDHPLAGRTTVDQKDLAAERLLLLEEGHCLRDQALSLCHAAGAEQADDFRASSLATVVQMVVNGYGGTILPSLALSLEAGAHSRLRVVPFTAPAPFRPIGLVWRSSSPRASDFVEFGRFVIATHQAAAGASAPSAIGPDANPRAQVDPAAPLPQAQLLGQTER